MIDVKNRELRQKNWQKRLAAILVAGIACMLFATFLFANSAIGENDATTGNSTGAGKPNSALYAGAIAETYDFKFGPNPFAPSNASSTTGTFIPAEMFLSSTRCGTCHTDAHAQWRQSAHGNAFREPFYQKNVKDLQNQKGIEFTRHCACASVWQVPQRVELTNISGGMKVPVMDVALLGAKGLGPNLKS